MQSGTTNANGGIINVNLGTSSNMLEIESCNFIGCVSLSKGGAIYALINNGAQVTISNSLFSLCESTNGGGIFVTMNGNSILYLDSLCSLTDCKSSSQGGGIYAEIVGSTSQLILDKEIQFERCESNIGGGLLIYLPTGADYELCKLKFIYCHSSNSGGGIYNTYTNGGMMTLRELSFTNCSSNINGGGYCVQFSELNCILEIIDSNITDCSSEQCGGGIYAVFKQLGSIIISGESRFKNCSAVDGGGIYALINTGSILQVENQCSFSECKTNGASGRGGGILAQITGSDSSFILQEGIQFEECSSNDGGALWIT
ncbi:MAG: hypothetical protein EZS28_033082, partial [Streblomastix strix]